MNIEKRLGLLPTPPDERDLKLGALVTLPKLSDLPRKFSHTPFEIMDQGDSDFCSAFSSCQVSSLQEGVPLDPSWSFAMSKKLSGGVNEYGQNIRDAMRVHTSYGAIESIMSPYTFNVDNINFLRNPDNWPAHLEKEAVKHKKKSYVKVTGPYDHYDNIRATIWKFRNEKRGVCFGTIWSWDPTEVRIKTYQKDGGGHMMAITGWNDEGLVVVNSWGTKAGNKGFHYFSRSVINFMVETYGAYMFVDLTPEELRNMIENGVKIGDYWWLALIKSIATAILDVSKVGLTKLGLIKKHE